MSETGTWLILIDSDREVTPASILEALRKVPNATVVESVFGTTVEHAGRSIGVAYSDAPEVLAQSKALAETFGKAHPEQQRVARASRRFEITFLYPDAKIVAAVLCDIESELALLVEEGGGRTFAFNPKTEEFF